MDRAAMEANSEQTPIPPVPRSARSRRYRMDGIAPTNRKARSKSTSGSMSKRSRSSKERYGLEWSLLSCAGAAHFVAESMFYNAHTVARFISLDIRFTVSAANIKLVAFDFDATIIDIHTGGRWKGTAEELAKHVRPGMQCFIRQCLERGIHVSVATFSTQTELISAVLGQTIDHEQAKAIPVFGDNDRVDNYDQGKQSQLLLSMNHFNQMHAQRSNPITPKTTLLVDDDADNIRVATADGYNTIQYTPGTSIYRAEVARPALPPAL